MDSACSTNGEKHIDYLERAEGKRLQGIPRCRWEDDIKIDLGGWDGVV
jgi:hypothetical protein